jgi:hypothetical protein
MIMIVMATACRVIMIVFVLLIRRFFARGLLLRQQGRLEAELAQRILDLFHRGFVFGKRKVQPLAGHRHLDVSNAGQAGQCGFDLGRAAAAIHAADRKGQRIVVFNSRLGRVMMVTAAGGMVVLIGLHLCCGRFFARQQSGLEAELAQRILDFFHRGFVFGKRKVQPLAGH